MPDQFNINMQLGPLFTIKCVNNSSPNKPLTLNVGTKSSSLFGGGGSTVIVSSEGVEITASEPLGQFRAVTYDGFYCDSTLNDLAAYAGVTTVALVNGATGIAIRSGIISDGLWTLTPNQPVFVTANGVLSQTPPALPIRRIGWAVSSTEINLDPYPIIQGDS